MYKNMTEIIAANREAGYHYFDTMELLDIKIESAVFGGEFFVTSRPVGTEGTRGYTIRKALPNGLVVNISQFQAYTTLCSARARAKQLAGCDTDTDIAVSEVPESSTEGSSDV